MIKLCDCGGIWNKRHDENGNPIWQCGLYSEHRKPRRTRRNRKLDDIFAQLGIS